MHERYTRYRDLIPPERLAAAAVTVIGVGAVGRQVALQLAAMGVGALQLIDHDRVDAVNLGPQGYHEADVGQLKVEATGAACRACHGELHLELVADRYRAAQAVHPLVCCCVDAIQTRQTLWRHLEPRVRWYADARMAAETCRVLVAGDEPSRAHYPTTLFSTGEAYPAPCTAKATLYCASLAAALLVAMLARHLRGLPVEADVQLNLLAMELHVTPVTARVESAR
jgi:sulfur carrier protein ThiS adenylyltransferase